MALLELKELSFTYPGESVPALDRLSFRVEESEFVVLSGLSGCGKSTLLRLLKPGLTLGGIREGSILYGGGIDPEDVRESAARVAYLQQSAEDQIVTDKVWHELAFGLESLGEDSALIRRRVAEVETFFGIEKLHEQETHRLSGGQKQLVSLAALMTLYPKLLLLDEPAASLDPIAAERFLSLLVRLNRELGITVIVAEQRFSQLLPYATKLVVLEKGRSIFCGDPREGGLALDEKKDPFLQAFPSAFRLALALQERSALPFSVQEGRAYVGRIIEKRSAENRSIEAQSTEAQSIEGQSSEEQSIKAKNIEKQSTTQKTEEPQGAVPESMPAAVVDELSFRYDKNGADILHALSLTIRKGRVTALFGANGSGKTSLLKLIAGVLKPQDGSVHTSGRCFMLPQEVRLLFSERTVLAQLKAAAARIHKDPEAAVREAAGRFQLDGLLSRNPHDLSGGEQKRLGLALVFLRSPELLLLDEPTAGTDVLFQQALKKELQTLRDSGAAIVLVTHDIEFAAEIADDALFLANGELAAEGSARDFLLQNRFYTTEIRRITEGLTEECVTLKEAAGILGGREAEEAVGTSGEEASAGIPENADAVSKETDRGALPLWRKLLAALFLLGALGVMIYSAASGSLSGLSEAGGVTPAGLKQLALYGGFSLLLFAAAIVSSVGRSVSKDASKIHDTRFSEVSASGTENRRKSRLSLIVSLVVYLLLIPAALFLFLRFFGGRQYYLAAIAILLLAFVPVFFAYEKRRPGARDIALVAALSALAVAGRAAFFMMPQFKPVMAIVIIAGAALGAESGFFTGAVSMLVSNILFSQGPWTPWQMFAMGLIGFLAGCIFHRKAVKPGRFALGLFGALSAILLYGGIMNLSSALIFSTEVLNLSVVLSYYVTGFPMDLIHAAATFIFIFFLSEPLLYRIGRIRNKYGL